MRKYTAILLIICALIALSACSDNSTPSPTPEVTLSVEPTPEVTETAPAATPEPRILLRIAHIGAEGSIQDKAAQTFSEQVSMLTNRFDIQIYGAAQLGTESEYLDALDNLKIEAAVIERNSDIDPRLDVLELPFIFDDAAHIEKVLGAGTELRSEFDGMFVDAGYKCMLWWHTGFRCISSAEPVKSAADLNGMDVNVLDIASDKAVFEKWGAKVKTIEYSELYDALKQEIVTAEEDTLDSMTGRKLYSVQKYLSQTNHGVAFGELILSKAFWDSLPEELQAILETAAANAATSVQAVIDQSETDALATLKNKKMTLVEDLDRESFKAGAQAVYEQFYDRYGQELIQKVLDAKNN